MVGNQFRKKRLAFGICRKAGYHWRQSPVKWYICRKYENIYSFPPQKRKHKQGARVVSKDRPCIAYTRSKKIPLASGKSFERQLFRDSSPVHFHLRQINPTLESASVVMQCVVARSKIINNPKIVFRRTGLSQTIGKYRKRTACVEEELWTGRRGEGCNRTEVYKLDSEFFGVR